jgi:hypothetical protein
MKEMAEFGGQRTLVNEMTAQGNKVLNTLRLLSIGSGTGSRSGDLDVDDTHSLVSLVSMIAPSPDWFAGVHGLDLCNETKWIQSKTVDLFPYDAGTDSGLKFTSANSVTNPRESIYRLTGTNPNNSMSSFFGYSTVNRMATLGFVLKSLTTPTPKTVMSTDNGTVSNSVTTQPTKTATAKPTTETTAKLTTKPSAKTTTTATAKPITKPTIDSSSKLTAKATLEPTMGGCPGNVQYQVTFDAFWTSSSHPKDYPAGSAHWSGLVGGSHNSQYEMWRPGGLSTRGMEEMAEFGGQTTLLNEMSQQGNKVLDTLKLSGIGSGTGKRSGDLDVDGTHSLVSLVSMIAPSPDWFVGVHDLDLCDGTTWIKSVTRDLFPYDAGTDSGLKFRSANDNTNPKEKIHLLTGTVPNNSQSSFYDYSSVLRMATLTLTCDACEGPTTPTSPSQESATASHGSSWATAGVLTIIFMSVVLLFVNM